MLCRDCYPCMVVAFAPLRESCPDRATSELMELTARLGSMMPYRQAARVLAEFLPVEPIETHATVRKRTIRIGERLHDQVAEEELHAKAQTDERCQLEMQLPGDRRKEFVISINTCACSQRRFQFSAPLRARCGPMRPRRAGRRWRPLFRDRQHRPTGNPGSRPSCPSGSRLPRLWRCDGDFGRRRNPEAATPRDAEADGHIIDWFHIAMNADAADRDHMGSIPIGSL